ncbi:MAG: hypothetical protein IH934_04410 [Nanoarchaeota archaeon]|nr:hypothetical protein [Nanoarchaeota archaeon]
MEKEIIISLGLIIGYLLFRFVNGSKQKIKNPTDVYSDMSELQSNSEHAQKFTISDILTNDKYKVKGQYDK